MIRVAAGILFRNGRFLICQRQEGGAFPLRWEFPGGKLRSGEKPAEALVRELEEELGIRTSPAELRPLETVRHTYPEGPEVEVHFLEVRRHTGRPSNRCFRRILWVRPGELRGYDFLEADRPLVARIAGGGVVSRP